jgi:hypothetical protein
VRSVQLLGIEDRGVARDDAVLFELPNPLVDCRSGEADLLGDRGMRHTSVLTKERQDLAIDPIEAGSHICGYRPLRTSRAGRPAAADRGDGRSTEYNAVGSSLKAIQVVIAVLPGTIRCG